MSQPFVTADKCLGFPLPRSPKLIVDFANVEDSLGQQAFLGPSLTHEAPKYCVGHTVQLLVVVLSLSAQRLPLFRLLRYDLFGDAVPHHDVIS